MASASALGETLTEPMPHYWLTSGGGAFCFFSFFNFRFSFRLSWAFFCFSLLPLSFFPLSAIFVSPCLKMTCAGLWRRNPVFGRCWGPSYSQRGEPYVHPTGSPLQTRCQTRKKNPHRLGPVTNGGKLHKKSQDK